ncbi:MAG: hypothetical protein KGZ82_13230 [Bacteroidales bacterium]|nr:hypothetical protein [Bacteroidales bacterium]
MSAPSFELLKETINNDEIVVVAGAGIHALNTNNNSSPEINKARKTLRDWNIFLKHVAQQANIDDTLLDNPELSPTLKWELLVNRIKGDLPADKKEKRLVDYVQEIAFNNEALLYQAYDLYSPVLQLIRH